MSCRSGNSRTEIVKVQLPLNGPGLALVYNRRRLRICQQVIPQAIARAMGDEAKAYFDAEWNSGTKRWVIGDLAPTQNW